jgi:hypothetical protein
MSKARFVSDLEPRTRTVAERGWDMGWIWREDEVISMKEESGKK